MNTIQFFKLICLTLFVSVVASNTGFCQYKKIVGKVSVDLSADSGFKVTQHNAKLVTITNAKGDKITFVNPQVPITTVMARNWLGVVLDMTLDLIANKTRGCTTTTTVSTTTKPDGIQPPL